MLRQDLGEKMSSVFEHYEKHLAPVYSWMAGGIESAIARGQQELTDIGIMDSGAKYAVDLGAGFGMHLIPLAKTGCKVVAVDFSAILLEELKTRSRGIPVTIFQDDLLHFPRFLESEPDIVLCMGDTLTHLPDRSSVKALIEAVAEHFPSRGQFVITFRDYSNVLEGANRFISVKSDASRILTCFLEYAEGIVQVHDILHELKGGTWDMRVSIYRKLRLEAGWVREHLAKCGFEVEVGVGLSGMVRFCATRANTAFNRTPGGSAMLRFVWPVPVCVVQHPLT